MQKQEMKGISASAIEDFAKHGVKIDAAEYEEHMRRLVEDFSVSPSMAAQATKTHYMVKHDLKGAGGMRSGDNPTVTVSKINKAGQWLNTEVKCIEIWESKSEKIKQAGLVGDETGKTKFVIWAAAPDVQPMILDVVYRIENAVVNEYQGKYSLSINKKTTITKLGKTIEVASGEATVVGAVVAVQHVGSGIIKRCLECKRVMVGGLCATHGKNKGALDLRAKVILDDGKKSLNVIFGKEITEGVVMMSMDKIKQLKAEGDEYLFDDALDAALLGRYMAVKGYYAGDWFIGEELEQTPVHDPDDVAKLYDSIKQEHKAFVEEA